MKKTGKTYRQKLILLAVGLALLAVCSWFLSIQKTLAARSEYRALAQQMEDIRNVENDLVHWRTLNTSMDRQLGGGEALRGFQENLLGTTGRFCDAHDLVLTEFSEPFEGTEGGYRVETIVLTLEGRFKPLLKLVHHLETGFKGGRLSSVEFAREKDLRHNRERLFLKLYVQKITPDEKES